MYYQWNQKTCLHYFFPFQHLTEEKTISCLLFLTWPHLLLVFGSVPCGPDNMLVNVDCTSGAINISWSARKNSEGYLAVISDSNNKMTSYNTSDLKLTIPAMQCGQQYTVRVKSFNRSCVSLPSEIKFSEGKRNVCSTSDIIVQCNTMFKIQFLCGTTD